MPEFAPLLKVVTTPVQADIVDYFQKNPGEALDAALLAGKIRPEEIESVKKALEELKSVGVLSSEVSGVAQSRHYTFTPDPSLKKALDRIFGDQKTQDAWQEFRIYLAEESFRRQRKRKLLIIVAGIVVVLGLGAGIYFLVQSIKVSGQEKPQEDLSQFTGVYETRYANGQVKSRIGYSNGQREGSFSAWFEGGQKMAEGSYRGNRPHGNWVYRNEKGEPLTMIIFEDGQAVD